MLLNIVSCTGQFSKERKNCLVAMPIAPELRNSVLEQLLKAESKGIDSIKKSIKTGGEMAGSVRCWVYECDGINLIPRTQLEEVGVVAHISALGR